MKKLIGLTILLFLGSFECALGQSSEVNKSNDRERSKQLIQRVNARVQLFLEQEKVEEASQYITQNEGQCNAVVDKKFCKAGLNFTQAYLFQQAATKNDANSEDYTEKASVYYEKVLKAYPDNKVAWSNLMKLNTKENTMRETIGKLKKLMSRLPEKKAAVLIEIGNLYRDNAELKKACNAYREAYVADPFLVKAYEAIVNLYTEYDFHCALGDIYDIREIARVCEKINLANRAEELLQKEFIDYIKAKKYVKAKESLLLWTDVLLNNGWVNSRGLNRLRGKLSVIDTGNPMEIKDMNQVLSCLSTMFKSTDINDFPSLEYWSELNAGVRVAKEGEYISSQSIFLKTLLVKGEKAVLKNEHDKAEAFWQKAWSMASKADLGNYLKVALNLAQLYNKHPGLDLNNRKFDAVILELFEGKEMAYRDNDLPIIREYHIVLGSIFYARKQWAAKATHPNAAANARFQLERAVSRRFGPIVNPKLRQMLGDVYVKLNQKGRAFDAYSGSVQDYLALDRVKDAGKLHQTIAVSASGRNEHIVLGKIIDLRKNAKDEKIIGTMSSIDVAKYVGEVSKIEKEAKTTLSKEFVNLQVFKTFTDSGSNLESNRNADRQILHSEALSRIRSTNKLTSPNDFKRIKTIKTSLEESVENPQNLDKTRFYNKTELGHVNSGWKSKTKSKAYSLNNLNMEILIPEQLFELNKVIKEDYKKSISKKAIPNIQLKDRKFQQVIKQ